VSRTTQAWAQQRDSESVMRLVRWVLLVTLGEAVGFSVSAAVGVAVTAVSWVPLATFLAMVLAGSVEGAALGVAQADCLFRWEVVPVRRWWVAATSLGAAVAWSLGMLPSILPWCDVECRNDRCGCRRRFDLAQLSAAGSVSRASRSCQTVGPVDSDQYGCLAGRDCMDVAAVPVG
jgi:hypothetical protein